MLRNSESYFAMTPQVSIQRSKMTRDSKLLTSFNVGQLVPIYLDQDILPGDTVQIKTNKVVRLQPMVTSPLDDLHMDTFYFFIPNRLLWTHWKNFMGENTATAWIPSTTYTIPQVTAPSGGWLKGTIADYMGVPTGVDNLSISALPFRAYTLVYNEWFRDQNLEAPYYWSDGDATVAGSNGSTFVSDCAKGGVVANVSKFHDMFTSCTPEPQKGPDVTLTLSDSNVYFDMNHIHDLKGVSPIIHFVEGSGDPLSCTTPNTASTLYIDNTVGSNNGIAEYNQDHGVVISGIYDPVGIGIDNGYISDQVVTINDLRRAFAIQQIYEKMALYGSRYTEVIRGQFGVTSPDFRLQRPEYLGGSRINLNINQVLQTSETNETPIGHVAGYSLTADSNGDFIYSATEHGIILGLACIRYHHTYSQGLERGWTRKTMFDYYNPAFANIGNVGIRNDQIYAQGSTADSQIFGYNEAWCEYRFKPSQLTGEMRCNVSGTLDSWHFGDNYTSLPSLGSSWIKEDKTNVDRVLAVTSSVSNQVFADFYFQCEHTRPMPMYSIPGLTKL